jgi:hypothetical protein
VWRGLSGQGWRSSSATSTVSSRWDSIAGAGGAINLYYCASESMGQSKVQARLVRWLRMLPICLLIPVCVVSPVVGAYIDKSELPC